MNVTIKTKIILLATIPVIITVLIMTSFFYFQTTKLGNNEIVAFKKSMMEGKKLSLKITST